MGQWWKRVLVGVGDTPHPFLFGAVDRSVCHDWVRCFFPLSIRFCLSHSASPAMKYLSWITEGVGKLQRRLWMFKFLPNPDLLFKKGFRNGHQFHQVFKTSFHPMISHHCSIKMAWTNLYYPLLSYIMLLWHSTACNYPFPHPFCRPSWHHTEIRPVPSNYATPVWPEMAIRIMLLLSGAYHISSCIHKNIQLYPQISPKWW